jgi:inhibitor of KinA
MVGFLPGFAYMGEVDERIAVPRKAEPRQKIEEGYVGIAGKQTGIYPLTSPGGWQIIGKTYLKLFDKDKEQPSLFAPGDEVQFFSITEDEFDNH